MIPFFGFGGKTEKGRNTVIFKDESMNNHN